MAESRHEIALIVGAGSGLSASLTRLFIRSGMRVAVAARNIDKLTTLCAETGAKSFACDVVDPD
jgi:NADP-dependent 3-hydroxy acid dehydrogenase YdfG